MTVLDFIQFDIINKAVAIKLMKALLRGLRTYNLS